MRMRADRYIPPAAFCHRAGWESLPWREDRSESRPLRHERATVRNCGRTVDYWSSYPPTSHRVTPLPMHRRSGAHSTLTPERKEWRREMESRHTNQIRFVDPGYATPLLTPRAVLSDDRRPLARPRLAGGRHASDDARQRSAHYPLLASASHDAVARSVFRKDARSGNKFEERATKGRRPCRPSCCGSTAVELL
jgi:hypothetical protein